MIENLRKYTGLIIFVIALLFVGLAFFGDNASFSRANASDPALIRVDGRTYTVSEFRKTGPSARNLAMGLGLYEFVSMLGGFGGTSEDEADKRFFVNRLLIKDAQEEFGVRPSDEEVTSALKAMPAFQGQDGAFDQTRYNDFVTQRIGQFGMTEKDVIDIVRDSIAVKKLASIIGGGLAGDRNVAMETVASRDQQVTVQVARTSLAKFRESFNPTDEELKAAWETTKDKYVTERKIKVSYIIAKPAYPEPKKEEVKLPDTLTEEDKQKADQEAAEKKAKEEAALAEEKRKINNELADQVDTFIAELQNSEGKDFEELVKKNNWELVTTELFPRTAVPPALSVNLRSSNDPGPVADRLFQLEMKDAPLDRFTEALPVPDGAWLLARLDEEEPSRTKTFEEAKEEVRTDYIAEKAGEALKKDADEKAAKIREALAAGKSFADAAKELGLEPKSHGPFKATDKLEGEADTTILFQTAAAVDPGTLADPVMRPDGALFVFVEKRELVKDPARAERVNQSLAMSGGSLERSAFAAWLDEKLESAKVENVAP